MAKRFTDTDKWKKSWFLDLPIEYKTLWGYILDNCDYAGVWDVNFKLASALCGTEWIPKKVKELFQKQFIEFDEGRRWWIPSFIDFQYGCCIEDLDYANTTQRGVLRVLQRFNLYELAPEQQRGIKGGAFPLQRGSDPPQAKVKDKDKVKAKDKAKEVVQYSSEKGLIIPNGLMEEFCAEYDRDLIDQELPKMNRWLKVNKPKKDYNRFVWNWLSRSKITAPISIQSAQVVTAETMADYNGFQSFLSKSGVAYKVRKVSEGVFQIQAPDAAGLFAKFKKGFRP